MNRHDRRASRAAWRAKADLCAALLARSCLDIGTGGSGPGRTVSDPLAIQVLERGFAHLLRHGGKPHVLRVSEAQALAFDPWQPTPGASWFMAVGLDRLGRASYVLRPLLPGAACPVADRRVIEAALLAELGPVLDDTSPLPLARRAA